MRRPPRYSTKIFPFAPGIPWKIKNSCYALPEINANVWNSILKDKDFTILCYGGLIESYLSLSIARALLQNGLCNKVSWAGRDVMYPLVKASGNVILSDFPDLSENYPTPIFLDKNNNAYINCLNNYLQYKKYWGKPGPIRKDPIAHQIFEKCTLPWNSKYIAQIDINNEYYIKWYTLNKFYDNNKFIIIIDSNKYSDNDLDYLQWQPKQIRELIGLMQCQTILVTDQIQYYNSLPKVKIVNPSNLELILHLIKNCHILLSRSVDWLILGMCISDANIFSRDTENKCFDLHSNAEYLGVDNVIYSSIDLSPMEVFQTSEIL